MRHRLFTKAYYEYNGILALGQFVTLGLALIGNLSRIYCILKRIGVGEDFHEPKGGTAHFEPPAEIADIGEEISIPEDEDRKVLEEKQPQNRKRSTSQSLGDSSELGNSNVTIDDIFASDLTKKEGKKKKKKKKKTLVDQIFDLG